MEFAQLTPGPGFDVRRSFLYYIQRLVTAPKLRRLIVATIRARIRAREGWPEPARQPLTLDEETSLRSLTESGFAPLQTLMTQRQLSDIHMFLGNKPLKDRIVRNRIFTINDIPEDARIADYALRDVLDCPHILELANSPSLLRLVTHYIGCKPTISALTLRWSFPSSCDGSELQAFHRDSDDWRYVKVMVYLTDVDATAGPHVYVLGTQQTKAPLRLRFYSDENIRQTYGDEMIVAVTGSSGFGFAVDTSGVHKGTVPTVQPRLMLQIQYSILPSYAYRYQPEPCSRPLQFDNYINRLILH